MEKFYPNQEFQITPEGEEAAIKTLSEKAENEPSLLFAKKLLSDHPEIRVCLVGGIIRDTMIGLPSKDYDLVIDGMSPEQLDLILPQYGHVKKVGRNFGVYNFRSPGEEGYVDIAVPRVDVYEDYAGKASNTKVQTENVSIEADFSRRDFTINAMGLDLRTGELLDPFDGSRDIREGKVRAVGDPEQRFLEDPSRILRGIRFACKYDFQIEESTLEAMIALKDEIFKIIPGKFEATGKPWQRVPADTIRREIIRAIDADPLRFFELFNEIDLMHKIFPQVSALKGVKQPPEYHSEGDAFVHTALVLKNLSDASIEAKFAGLLHDIGKAETSQGAEETGGRIQFIGHEIASAHSARNIMNGLRFTNDFKDSILWIIKNHMTVLNNFPHMRLSKQKELIRHKNFPDLIQLAQADALSSLRPDGTSDLSFLDSIKKTLALIKKEEEEGRKPKLNLNGHEVISEIKSLYPEYNHTTEARLIKIIIKDLNDRYHNREIESKEESLDFLRNHFGDYLKKLNNH